VGEKKSSSTSELKATSQIILTKLEKTLSQDITAVQQQINYLLVIGLVKTFGQRIALNFLKGNNEIYTV
jgi:hypothetical protein